MVEQYAPREEISDVYQIDGAESLEEIPWNVPESDVIHVDLRPKPSIVEIRQRIAEVATHWWLTKAGSGAISHELIDEFEVSAGKITNRFKQYSRGFSGTDGILHEGSTGIETVRILDLELDTLSHKINHFYVNTRNLRFSGQQSRERIAVNHSDTPPPNVSKGSKNRPAG